MGWIGPIAVTLALMFRNLRSAESRSKFRFSHSALISGGPFPYCYFFFLTNDIVCWTRNWRLPASVDFVNRRDITTFFRLRANPFLTQSFITWRRLWQQDFIRNLVLYAELSSVVYLSVFQVDDDSENDYDGSDNKNNKIHCGRILCK